MIYLGSPYSHSDAMIRYIRYLQVEEACSRFFPLGKCVYSPIMHWHRCAQTFKLPTEAKFWQRQNYPMMERASEFGVLMLDGWLESEGLFEEQNWAKALGIPTMYYRLGHDDVYLCDAPEVHLLNNPARGIIAG